MERKEKISQFKVSIRRKQVNQKLANLRVKQLNVQEDKGSVEDIILNIKNILSNPSITFLYSKVEEIKQYTQNLQVICILKDYFEGFYQLLLQVDIHYANQIEKADEMYSSICCILINIVSYENIDFTEEVKKDIFSPIISNIKRKHREIDTIWFIANLLYRKNKLSQSYIKMLIKHNIAEYIRSRVSCAFESDSASTIFYYFVGGVVAVLGLVDNFNDFKALISEINYLSQLQIQQCYLYILDGLIFYASEFNKHSYQIFSFNIFKKCEGYCKNKKSRFVGKYLEIVVNFLNEEQNLLLRVNEDARKKLVSEQYERCKKYGIIKNMQFCLENRSPDVKKLLCQAAYILIASYFKDIDLKEEYFYLTFAEQVKNIEKYDENLVYFLLRYMEILIIQLLKVGNISKNSLYSQNLLKFIEANLLFEKIQLLVKQYLKSPQILNLCFDIVAYLQEYNIPSLVQTLKKANLLPTLESLEITIAELSRKRDILVEFISSQHNEMILM